MDKWMTAKEVAEHLKVSLATVYRWTDEGRLTKYQAGRVTRYKRDEVDEALKQNRRESKQRMFKQWVEDHKND